MAECSVIYRNFNVEPDWERISQVNRQKNCMEQLRDCCGKKMTKFGAFIRHTKKGILVKIGVHQVDVHNWTSALLVGRAIKNRSLIDRVSEFLNKSIENGPLRNKSVDALFVTTDAFETWNNAISHNDYIEYAKAMEMYMDRLGEYVNRQVTKYRKKEEMEYERERRFVNWVETRKHTYKKGYNIDDVQYIPITVHLDDLRFQYYTELIPHLIYGTLVKYNLMNINVVLCAHRLNNDELREKVDVFLLDSDTGTVTDKAVDRVARDVIIETGVFDHRMYIECYHFASDFNEPKTFQMAKNLLDRTEFNTKIIAKFGRPPW